MNIILSIKPKWARLNYGCRTPTEMKRLIDDLVNKINKLEKEDS